jgi:hypothetical protein
MSSYLDTYGVAEERRNKFLVRAVLALLGVIVLSVVGYFGYRNFREQRKMAEFRQLLEKKDYNGAYAFWGCTPAKPCKDYSLERFLEDWGPQSPHTNFASVKVVRSVTCRDGYGQGWQFNTGNGTDTIHVWVVREDQSLSYDPWPNWQQTWIAAIFNDCRGLNRMLPDFKKL